MKFEIGKTYTFRNVSTEESVSFKKGDDGVYEDRVWTGGTWTFTLDDENVLDALMYAQSEDDPSTFEFDDDGIDVVFKIFEGQKIQIERVNITGNTVTNDSVLRSGLLLDEGDPYSKIRLEKSISSLKSKKY